VQLKVNNLAANETVVLDIRPQMPHYNHQITFRKKGKKDKYLPGLLIVLQEAVTVHHNS
jgi:hypothetical protein